MSLLSLGYRSKHWIFTPSLGTAGGMVVDWRNGIYELQDMNMELSLSLSMKLKNKQEATLVVYLYIRSLMAVG